MRAYRGIQSVVIGRFVTVHQAGFVHTSGSKEGHHTRSVDTCEVLPGNILQS